MTWDDPMKVDWGDPHHTEVPSEEPAVSSPPPDVSQKEKRGSWPSDHGESAGEAGVTRCVAIYTYTVSNQYLHKINTKFIVLINIFLLVV